MESNMPTNPATVSATSASNVLHLLHPIWDPVPDWIKFDEQRLHEFGQLQIQTKLKELELTKLKLEQLQKLSSR
jgi:hypothetical protein